MRALHEAKTAGVPGVADIEIDTVRGRINATIDNLVAAGRIKLGPVIAEQGDATVRNLTAGATSKN